MDQRAAIGMPVGIARCVVTPIRPMLWPPMHLLPPQLLKSVLPSCRSLRSWPRFAVAAAMIPAIAVAAAAESLASGSADELPSVFADEGVAIVPAVDSEMLQADEALVLPTGLAAVPPRSADSGGRAGRLVALTSRIVGGAEYLLLRPSFSNATAMYRNTRSAADTRSQLDAVNFSPGYSSGVRGFLGWRLAEDSLVRFAYLDLAASDTVTGAASGDWAGGNGTAFIGPYVTDAIAEGESIQTTLGTQLRLYDLELAARLHTRPDTEGRPLWETAGGVGIRFADSRVSTDVVNRRGEGFADILVGTSREFRGVGPRLAYQVRRGVLGDRISFFATGAASLLIGDYDNVDTRVTLDPVAPADESQQVGGPLLVPNADFSIGGTWQMTPRTTFSAGWLLLYFGELGYSEVINTEATPPGSLATSLALANSSLFLDGAFFRLTHSF